MISISKIIDWKIACFDEGFLTKNSIHSKKIPIINPRNDQKICDLSLQMFNYSSSSKDFQFTLNSTPVSEAIFFEASVALLDSRMTGKLREEKCDLKEYQKGQEIQSEKSMVKFSLLTTSKNLILNVRCEVTSKLSKTFSTKNPSFKSFQQITILLQDPEFAKQEIFEKSSKISDFYSTLYKSKNFSDVILIVGGSKIHAHKLILSARSKYFAQMFGPDFKELFEAAEIEVREDERVFRKMIEIFYTNDVSEVDFDEALELIVLASKYLVDELVKSCEEIILRNMTIANCLDILLVADSVQLEPFKDRCIAFILANIKSVLKTPAWEILKAENPDLVIEVTTKMLE
jgi:hypothetical protein